MSDTSGIKEHMAVVGSDGAHVGTVDKVEGQRIKLAKSDPLVHDQHHYIEIGLVQSVGDEVILKVPSSAARASERTT